jgi:hypothetical protein
MLSMEGLQKASNGLYNGEMDPQIGHCQKIQKNLIQLKWQRLQLQARYLKSLCSSDGPKMLLKT